jgi:hypothetical protein
LTTKKFDESARERKRERERKKERTTWLKECERSWEGRMEAEGQRDFV